MSDDANDVAKALAAFGAPSIRYHSFGQAQIKPSSVVLPRRAAPPAPEEAPQILTRQNEPVAAPELAPARSEPPMVAVAPLEADNAPAPLLRQAEPLHATVREPMPTVAPPPRPLAEWAAPLTPATVGPVVAPAALVRPSAPIPAAAPPSPAMAPAPAMAAPPQFPTAPSIPQPAPPALVQHAPVQPAAMAVPPVPPTPVPQAPAHTPTLVAATPSHTERNMAPASQKAAGNPPGRNLQEIFEYLISGPGKVEGLATS